MRREKKQNMNGVAVRYPMRRPQHLLFIRSQAGIRARKF